MSTFRILFIAFALCASPPAFATPPLTDGQIAAIVQTANDGEIALAQLARVRASSAVAQYYAERMIADHTNGKKTLAATLALIGETPEPSLVALQLALMAFKTLAKLAATPPAAFDCAYLRSQVEMHTHVLSLIDTKLLPAVDNSFLDIDLSQTRGMVYSHLWLATHIADEDCP